MRLITCALSVLLLSGTAQADGLPLKDGRYVGPVLVLQLTESQKQVIEIFRTCQLENFKTMNVYTPYVFQLTSGQAKSLKAKAGFAPRFFEVYETYRGFNDAGPHWNIAARFSPDEIEIPLNLLLPDRKAGLAHKAQGWKTTNPCFPSLGKS